MAKRKKQSTIESPCGSGRFWYKVESVPRKAIRPFGEQHGLQLTVVERSGTALPRYYAHFRGVEEKDGCMLIGAHGNGQTTDAAIADYAARISNKLLIFGAYTPYRREIQAPKLYHIIQHPELRPNK